MKWPFDEKLYNIRLFSIGKPKIARLLKHPDFLPWFEKAYYPLPKQGQEIMLPERAARHLFLISNRIPDGASIEDIQKVALDLEGEVYGPNEVDEIRLTLKLRPRQLPPVSQDNELPTETKAKPENQASSQSTQPPPPQPKPPQQKPRTNEEAPSPARPSKPEAAKTKEQSKSQPPSPIAPSSSQPANPEPSPTTRAGPPPPRMPAGHEKRLAALEARLQELERTLAKSNKTEQLATRVDLAAKNFKKLGDRVEHLEGRIAGIEKSIEPLKKMEKTVQANLAEFKKVLNSLPAKLKELEAELKNVALTRVEAPQDKGIPKQAIKGIELEIDAIRQRLEELESLLNILNQQVSEVSNTVEELSQALAGKPSPRVPNYVIEALRKLKR